MSTANLGIHSWRDFVATAARRATEPELDGAGDASVSGPSSFTGTQDIQAAVKMANEGWPEGANKITKALDTLPPSSEVLPDWMLDVSGSICNVPAFIAGEPECMWNMSECRRAEHRVSLVVPAGYPGMIDADTAMTYAIAVAANVRSLEASGLNVAVYSMASHAGTETGTIANYGVVIREFGEPLDLAKVAFSFHPSWLRRLVFAWLELNPDALMAGVANSGYGLHRELTKDQVREVAGEDIGSVIVLPSIPQLGRAADDIELAIAGLQVSIEKQIKELV